MGLDVLQRTRQARTPQSSREEDEELVEEIKDSCKIAVTILDDLLTYEKIDSGILALDISSVNVASLIRSTVALFSVQARGKNLRLVVLENRNAISEDLEFDVDAGKIAQCLRNYVSNAIKFSNEGGLIFLNAFEVKEDNGREKSVTIQVVDSGVGIEPANIAKLFHEIIQFDVNKLQVLSSFLDDSISLYQGGGGSGMGLWVTKQIVELHGGRVLASSEGIGHGCTFEIVLPLTKKLKSSRKPSVKVVRQRRIVVDREVEEQYVQAVETVEHNKQVSGESSLVGGDALIGYHCLVVDDSKLNRKMMLRLLGCCNFNAEEAEDGRACVDRIREAMSGGNCVIDAVLMDYMMPNLDGPSATRELRQMGYDGVIIGITGNALPEDIQRFLESGAEEVLVKPITADKLEDSLLSILRKRHSAVFRNNIKTLTTTI